jgi:hypothetical protein
MERYYDTNRIHDTSRNMQERGKLAIQKTAWDFCEREPKPVAAEIDNMRGLRWPGTGSLQRSGYGET